ncbi:MAG: aminotransferase class V-fold PLP-dependent enzyme [Methanofollis sp.]|uniref:aminotransferase class V-fold PLP-dependent enzyme n=1 Tax=Methanofollis sp. TaxID=2052835 RepID=UPI00261FAEB5|nr:aminotransferase class V-fold PLP-dependent enzyme [Methanofollis sp.]MDD4255708.1 aminotransferase class V-fold PLP-dependent enzyme [Methanofollis sp.]
MSNKEMYMGREPPVKKVLFWCDRCNVPLIGQKCGCGAEGKKISLLQPYEVRPALKGDMDLITRLVHEQFGTVPLPRIMLLNKTGGVDRADLVIAHGGRFGWLTFDPVNRRFNFDIAPEALPYILDHASKGIVDLDSVAAPGEVRGRIGGKKFTLTANVPEGTVIVKYRNRYGTGTVKEGQIRVKEVVTVETRRPANPDWNVAIRKNQTQLKNLEQEAIRTIRRHMNDRPTANVSFSGGKDSTAVLHLARKAGIEKAFFIDTGIEIRETLDFVASRPGVEIIEKGGDFWQAVEKAGPPGKDNRWCCKLLKLQPLKLYLAGVGPCVTVQGNRWYESWNRASLEETSQNPANPLQLNVSPIRTWRALEVFLYLWWQKVEINPLYDMGLERIGCFLCPSMLESEYELLRETHPDMVARWDAFLEKWAERKGLPDEYCRWGLWRWRALPPKMREVCRNRGIAFNDDYSVRATKEKVVRPAEAVRGEAAPGPEIEEEGFPVERIRRDFPILGDIVYLDNAATSFSPEAVVEAMVEFEHRYRANVGRGVHRLTQIASQRYWHAHEKVAAFIGGKDGVTVFTKNTTEAVNMVAQGLSWKPGDRVVTTILEHHSNLLPWTHLKKQGVEVVVIPIKPDASLDLDAFREAVEAAPPRLVAVTHASNVLGTVTPVEEIARICHEHGSLLLVDGAQSVPHMPVDVARIGCDFFCFSGHKMLGPTGTGVLWMKEPILEPTVFGGGMVEAVTADGFTPAAGYQQYEAGTPNIGGGIGLGAAVGYLEKIGMEEVRQYEEELTTRLIDGLKGIEGVHVYAAEDPAARIGVVSFTIDGLHPHEVAQQLDEGAEIMVRSGHHCCMPLMEHLGLPEGTVRASLALYTTRKEVDLLVASVAEICRGL